MLYFLSLNEAPEIILTIVLAYFLAVCIAISFHEYAHSFSAYKCGDITPKANGRLTLNPFAHFSGLGLLSFLIVGFGWAKPVKINPNNFRNHKKGLIAVSLSGVLTNLALAFLFSGVLSVLGAVELDYSNLMINFIYYFVYFCVVLNLALFIFNLLPIYPLDGFNFLATFLKYDNKFVQFMYRYGPILLIIAIMPVFYGQSLLQLLYNKVILGIISLFSQFWGLFF